MLETLEMLEGHWWYAMGQHHQFLLSCAPTAPSTPFKVGISTEWLPRCFLSHKDEALLPAALGKLPHPF